MCVAVTQKLGKQFVKNVLFIMSCLYLMFRVPNSKIINSHEHISVLKNVIYHE